jgi:hypothetical protein
MWTEANLLVGRGMTLSKTIFPNKRRAAGGGRGSTAS